MPSELTTTEKYLLAQLLVCGKVNYDEFTEACTIPQRGTGVRDSTLRQLDRRGVLEHSLYEG